MRSEHSPEPVEPQDPEGKKRYRKVRPEDEERGQQTDPNRMHDRDD